MRLRPRSAPGTAVLLAACTAIAAAGCASTHSTAGTVTTTHSTAGTVKAASPGPRQRASTDAAALLRAFVVPPGARRLRRAPAALKNPITTLVSVTLVDDVSFWLTQGRPRAVLAWEQARLPRRFTPGDSDFGPPSWDRMFSLSPVPGVLNARDLVVEVTRAGDDQTAIRVDAQVSWEPPRPALERVPATARVVTITRLPVPGPHARRPPAPVTITRLVIVRRLAALADSLQLSTIGPGGSCPALVGGGIRLAFLARTGGHPLAVVQGPAECGTIQFSAGGRRQPALQDTTSFIPRVLRLAGLHWNVP
jgi:hypothetical protein